jgi:hypothetical protein
MSRADREKLLAAEALLIEWRDSRNPILQAAAGHLRNAIGYPSGQPARTTPRRVEMPAPAPVVSEEACPGGVGDHTRPPYTLCCDACWARVPTRIPGWPVPWRTSLKGMRTIRDWHSVQAIHDAIRAWLRAHPVATAPAERTDRDE